MPDTPLTKHCSEGVWAQVTSISFRQGERMHFIEKIIATLVSSLTLDVPSTVKSKLDV